MKWTVKVNSFIGVAPGAEHHYGYLQPPDKRENPNIMGGAHGWPPNPISVEGVLDEESAKRLSTDDFVYKAGMESSRFFSREAAMAAAIEQFQRLAEPGDVLVSHYDDMVYDEPTELARKEALS